MSVRPAASGATLPAEHEARQHHVSLRVHGHNLHSLYISECLKMATAIKPQHGGVDTCIFHEAAAMKLQRRAAETRGLTEGRGPDGDGVHHGDEDEADDGLPTEDLTCSCREMKC